MRNILHSVLFILIILGNSVSVKANIIPQVICITNFKIGMVLYASSARPIKKPKLTAIANPINSLFNKVPLC